jgi:hypothetical protein
MGDLLSLAQLPALRPTALIMTAQDALKRVEHLFELDGAVQHSKNAQAQRLGEFASVVPAGSRPLNDDRGWRRGEPIEQLEQPGAPLFDLILLSCLIEREGKINDGDVDGDLLDELGGLLTGLGTPGANAHRLHQCGERLDPRLAPPTAR